MLVFLFLSFFFSGLHASGGIYNSTCASNADCWAGLTCQNIVGGSGNCLTGSGMFNAPCSTYSCYGNASNTWCMASSQCNSNYYCQYQGPSLYCLQGAGPIQPSLGGTWGFPCSSNASCYNNPPDTNAYYCEQNPSNYGTYGQPVCMLTNKLNMGYCTGHPDCMANQNSGTTYRCGTLSSCGRGSCDIVLRQCDKPTSPLQSFWHNTNCYPLNLETPQNTSCTGTCPCGI